jgi:MFS family permease
MGETQIITSMFVLDPLSKLYGRVVVLQASNLLFHAFNIRCGFATLSGQLLAFRFIAGVGGSAPPYIGGSVLADLFHSEQR